MRIVKCICDLCGINIVGVDFKDKFDIIYLKSGEMLRLSFDLSGGSRPLDICDTCKEKLRQFLDSCKSINQPDPAYSISNTSECSKCKKPKPQDSFKWCPDCRLQGREAFQRSYKKKQALLEPKPVAVEEIEEVEAPKIHKCEYCHIEDTERGHFCEACFEVIAINDGDLFDHIIDRFSNIFENCDKVGQTCISAFDCMKCSDSFFEMEPDYLSGR